MDHVHNDSEPRRSGSFSRISSTNSSFRRHSFTIFGSGHLEVVDDSVSEAGDIGNRALFSNRFDNIGDNLVVPIQEHSFLESQSPTASPISPDAIIHEKTQNQESKQELPWFLTYMSSWIHLAAFGILGVLTRYLLEKLFDPASSDNSFIYIDLLPNMVGSFLMGWFGPVFKSDISKLSPELAVGLTTGYLGSLTTFSGWNQKMLELSVNNHWVYTFLGFSLGLFFVFCSFVFGVWSAKGFKWALNKTGPGPSPSSKSGFCEVNNIIIQSVLLIMMVTLLGILWGVSVALLIKKFNSNSDTSHLWFGCIVGPVGVWVRFYLARLNGQGLGRKQIMKWLPFGTLIANVVASCIMVAFATLKKDRKDKDFNIVATGLQFGLCGCMSTVSTFIAEFGAMVDSEQYLRAFVYAFTSIIISFSLGTLIYSVPVWTKDWS